MMYGWSYGGDYGSFMHPGFFAGFGIFMLWSIVWKGLALWKAARRGEQWWFVALLVVNTVGLLEILYLYVFTKGGPDRTLNAANKAPDQETTKA